MKKPNLYVVTLEPIEKRYTKQWYKQWKIYFSIYFNVHYIDGHKGLDDKIGKGRFLDINKTNIVKAKQVEKISKLFQHNIIEEGDAFIFMDAFHFGITATRYMSQLNNIKVKIFGYWHAGTWDEWDFISLAGLNYWVKYIEAGWLKALDGNFVATKFHRKLICNKLISDLEPREYNEIMKKIYVVGFPMNWVMCLQDEGFTNSYPINEKDNVVLFPHRINEEKQPEKFDLIEKLVNKNQDKKIKFLKTMEITKNKDEYYKLMNESKISFSCSLQETFGIGTVEAVFFNTIPIVPNKLSYVELYPKEFRYNNDKEAVKLINKYLNTKNYKQIENKLKKLRQVLYIKSLFSFKTMSNIMLGK